jgi:hypothetical protein
VQVALDSSASVRQDSTRAADQLAVDDTVSSMPFVAVLPAKSTRRPRTLPPRAVPDVRGQPLRRAVLALHGAGFNVRLVGGPPGVTSPAAGAVVAAGTTVQLGGIP